MLNRFLLIVIAGALLGACGKSPEPGEVSCSSDDDCPKKYECIVNACFPEDFDENYCDHLDCGENASCFEGRPPVCGCDEGFEGDGITCEDIDECADGTAECGEHAVCNNTEGLFECVCEDGYEGDGVTCTNSDECTDGTDDCDVNATCTDTEGSFDCECLGGFEGDGVTCDDIDECEEDPCHPNATCDNFDGGFECLCDDGFYGDGYECFVSVGQVIWMGHDFYSRNDDVDQLIGNAIAQATTLDVIEVAGYTEAADLAGDGEVVNTDAAIHARLVELDREATITHFDSYLELDLAGVDVLLVYEQELGVDAPTIAGVWQSDVRDFIADGGIVVVLDHYSNGHQILDNLGLMRFAGQYTAYGDIPVSVRVADDPVVSGVPTTYTGSNGTTAYYTNDGEVLVVDPAGVPVVVHKTFGDPRFDGSVGPSWETLTSNGEGINSLMTYQPSHLHEIYNFYDSTGQRYNPATDIWKDLVATGPASNPWFQMAPVGTNFYGWSAYTTGLWRYDSLNENWTNPAVFAGGGTNEYSMAVADEAGVVYGYVSNGNVLAYNPSTNVVSLLPTDIPTLRGSGSLYETRIAYDPVTRSLYLAAFNDAELYRYDLDFGTTDELEPHPESFLNDIFCGDRSGHLYAAGADAGTTLYQYDMASDTWTGIPDLPVDHGNSGSCVVSEEGYLYVSPGSTEFFRLQLF